MVTADDTVEEPTIFGSSYKRSNKGGLSHKRALEADIIRCILS